MATPTESLTSALEGIQVIVREASDARLAGIADEVRQLDADVWDLVDAIREDLT